ncbi:MAG: isoleucine--tRNA ligase [Candidatus Altiarchaeota archaeon]|nr:isoleucine--tRNA ligase [Candidatus Altiarchaeota archaeon]
MDVQKKWEKLKLVEKVQSGDGEDYWMLDGPPYPNAAPHMGHVRGLTIKDALIKMRFMQGKRQFLQPGFDCHGLPIENKVEKENQIHGKQDIEKMGVSNFMKACREFATSNLDQWMQFYKDMGIWFGWVKPYKTLDFEYMNSVWWSVSELWNKDLLKLGEKPFHWCTSCQTVLSGYEVTDEYREQEDPSIFVKFKTNKGFSLLVWTTTPWTLPGNVALVVRGDADYVKVTIKGEKLVLAKARLPALDDLKIKYKVLATFKGTELEGTSYEALIECEAQASISDHTQGRKVYLSKPVIRMKVASKVAEKKDLTDETLVEHFTNLSDGTGIVHCAPGHGPEDFELGRTYDLPMLSPVDEEGKFTEDVGLFSGMHVKEANDKILTHLKTENKLLVSTNIVHRYPICWRCKTPLIFRMTEQWVFEIDKVKKRMLEEVEKIQWMPEFAKQRMIDWVSNAKDWVLSRQRYWNTPLPIWRCEEGHTHVISGAEELSKLVGKEITDLHRDSVDNLTFKCKSCNLTMKRIEDVLDVWYDSGSSSFAALGYPKNKELFNRNFPTQRIEEGQDQIRGWFYALLVLGVALFDKLPYQSVSMHGWVVDKKGEKMSKSKGNFVTAQDAMERLGIDTLRYYILSEAVPWETFRYQPDRAKELVNKILMVWRNLNRYLVSYVEVEAKKGELKIEDKWLLSRLNTTIKKFSDSFESYHLNRAMRTFREFLIEDLSRSYMKLAKERVKEGDGTPIWVIKKAHHAMMRMMAPIMPFVLEDLYESYSLKFGGEESVYLEKYPEADERQIDLELETSFAKMLKLVETVLAFRDEKGISMRYPLPYVYVPKDLEAFSHLITLTTNCKETGRDKRGTEIEVEGEKLFVDGKLKAIHQQEGLMREVARRVQMFRKKEGLKASEKIKLNLSGDSSLITAVKKFENDFTRRVGVSKLSYEGGTTEFKIKDKLIKIGKSDV